MIACSIGMYCFILGECLTLLASGSDPFDYLSEQFNVSTHHYDTACE